MQKQQIIIQATYETVTGAIKLPDGTFKQFSLSKYDACAQLIITLQSLLHPFAFTDLASIIVSRGPAPSSTLNGLLATINGIGFAAQVPLIGVDGLEAILHEHTQVNRVTCALFNAYGQSLFYGIMQGERLIDKGCLPITHVLSLLGEYEQVYCIGQGVSLIRSELNALGSRVIIPDPFPEYPSFAYLAAYATEPATFPVLAITRPLRIV